MYSFFHPTSVAVVGASATVGKVGHSILQNLVYGSGDGRQRDHGFQGPIYPINPREADILGLPAYPSIADVPGEVDLACIVVPAPAVPSVL
jgi:acyl-CoA synthetase (NDP forming)